MFDVSFLSVLMFPTLLLQQDSSDILLQIEQLKSAFTNVNCNESDGNLKWLITYYCPSMYQVRNAVLLLFS